MFPYVILSWLLTQSVKQFFSWSCHAVERDCRGGNLPFLMTAWYWTRLNQKSTRLEQLLNNNERPNWITETYSYTRFMSTVVQLTSGYQYMSRGKNCHPPSYTWSVRLCLDSINMFLKTIFGHQGVLKVRKRVTLMVATVSAIFALCWMSGAVTYLVAFFSPVFGAGDVAYVTQSTVVMFNSAVNPIVYALINQQFSKKIKYMMCCRCYTELNPVREERNLTDLNQSVVPVPETEDTAL